MDISTIVNDKRFQIAIGSVIGAGIGFTIGYILGKKNGEVFEISEEAIREFNISDQTVSFVSDDVSSEDTDDSNSEDTEDVTEPELPFEEEYTGEVVNNTSSHVNIFTNNNNDWDYEAELSSRKPGEPYILHQDEFISDEMGYRQDTCTYYQGDDVMTDPHDSPIYNYKSLMGELKFGHGSNDPNVVYIRNESMEMEWEVLLHTGFYSYEVLGYEFEKDAQDEIRHSVQKFRMD